MFVTAVVIQGPDDISNDRPAFGVKISGARIATGMAGSIFLNQQGADLSLEQIQVTDVTATMFVLVDNRFAANADTQTSISETDVSNSSIDVSAGHTVNLKYMRQLASVRVFAEMNFSLTRLASSIRINNISDCCIGRGSHGYH
jgi:hypothetical protein